MGSAGHVAHMVIQKCVKIIGEGLESKDQNLNNVKKQWAIISIFFSPRIAEIRINGLENIAPP
jgi:hypothetical protein